MAAKIKKGDRVILLTGKDKGRTGQVTKVLPKDGRLYVSGLNLVQRHTRPSQGDPQGGIKTKEASVHVSNIAHIDPKSKLPTRVGYRTLDDGRKVRFAKRSGDQIDA